MELYDKLDIQKLEAEEGITAFDCGDQDLNDFILHEANDYRKALLAVTYVAIDKENDEPLAYFSLANDRVSMGDFESRTEFNRFRKHRFVNEKRIKSYPAAKICRLAVSSAAKGRHIGTFLLDFIKSYFLADNKTGCRFLTVDAYLNAVSFYQKEGFEFLNEDDKDSMTRLLYFDLASL